MSLFGEGFELIQSGKKSVEVRLYDEKRHRVELGDFIDFSLLPEKIETIRVKVISIAAYSSFQELYEAIDFALLGREDKSMDWMLQASYDAYSPEQEKTYGVIAIHYTVLNDSYR